MPQYELRLKDGRILKLYKNWHFFKRELRLESQDPRECLSLEALPLSHQYRIWNAEGDVATVRAAWLSWGDAYEINISEPSLTELILALVLVIDCDNDENQNR